MGPVLSARVRALALAVLVVVAAALLAYVVLGPRTLTDVGPLDLPGIPEAPATGERVLLAVGDIAACDRDADEEVARLAQALPGTIATLGDTVYPQATRQVIEECLEPAWGELRDRIRPAAGNHDYVGGDASAFFDWFGEQAGTTGTSGTSGRSGEGWYTYDIGAWKVVVLNSMCAAVGGCGPGSPQLEWLTTELAADPSDCLLAYWHHPRYSSGRHGGTDAVEPLWRAVADAGVDVTLHGHDHSYERLEVDGAQSFVAGTGGRSLYQFTRDPLPQTAARHDGSYGLLYLVLGDGTFSWEFLPLGLTTFTDAGDGTC